jgi:hypothetical protein
MDQKFHVNIMRKGVCVLVCIAFLALPVFCQTANKSKTLLVCGDSKVLMVDYNKSRDTIPTIVWTWDAHAANDLPDEYRNKKFNSVDDCKSANNGKQILVSSSGGAIAVLDSRSRQVLFYASVPNAHSIELLPDNLLAAAASTAVDGNKIMLFDSRHPDKPLFTDSLYSAHGLVWDEKRKSLFALGYDVLREYTIISRDSLYLKTEWKIPGIGGHDLQPSADGKSLFVTEHNGCWIFDLEKYSFRKIEGFPDAHNIKSLGQDRTGQFIYTVPENSWWTYHVNFFKAERRFAFPGMKVYKARWFSK